MLTKETKKHIDNARDILVGQFPLPSDQIELITIALIYKFMDDIDERTRKLRGSPSFFKDGLTELSWRKVISNELSADERVAKFIAAMEGVAKAEHIQELFKSIFKNAFLKFRDGRILKMFMDEINYFEYSHSEELGNAFEYLLNSMGTQAENGQFRTPRNIIDFIVEVVDPQKDETILDPACGTAGFLISAYKHILRRNTKGYEDFSSVLRNYNIDEDTIRWGDSLTQDEMQQVTESIVGYDITPLMGRLSRVNMYLHHFANPQIHEYDTLTNDTRWKEKYDCILANPPFMSPQGGVQPHDKFRIRARRTEVLFSDYMLEHLTPNGKAGFIVPEGIIFQNNGDYVDLRKWLIEEAGLWGVVSLPAMIFQPYSGVKTSILLIDRKLARERDSIILMKVENDGFSLNTNRTQIDKNDLPSALRLLTAYKRDPKSPALAESDDAKAIKFSVLPRVEFERLDSYRAATTGWTACQRAFLRLKQAEVMYNEKKNEELDEKQRKKLEDKWQRQSDEFLSQTHYHIGGLPESEETLKQWYEKYVKTMCVSYSSDPKKPIEHTNGGPYLSDYLKEKLDNKREYSLSLDRYTSNGKIRAPKWPLVKLSSVCEKVLSGGTPSTEVHEYWKGIIPWMTSADIVSLREIRPRRFITEEAIVKSATNLIPKGNIIVVTRVGLGKVVMNDLDICISQDSQGLVLNRDLVVPEFLLYILSSEVQKFKTESRGTTIQGVVRSQLLDLLIPLPPIDVQQRLAAELDSYQKVIDGCTAVIENYRPSISTDHSWPQVRMTDICSFKRGPFGGSLKKEMFVAKGYKVYEQKHAIRNDFTIGSYYIDEQKYKEMIGFALESDDLIMSCSGTFGRVAIFPSNAQPGIINQALLRLRANKTKILPHFLKLLLETNRFQSQLFRGASGVAIQNVASVQEITSFEVPLPPLEIQEKIVAEYQKDLNLLEETRRLKSRMEARIRAVIDSVWGDGNAQTEKEENEPTEAGVEATE